MARAMQNSLVVLSLLLAVSSGYTPAVCNFNATIENRLQGSVLTFAELDWAPFGIQDKTKTGNDQWSGVNKELIQLLANRLGFTYNIIPASPQSPSVGQSWTQLAEQLVQTW